jgi:hypothetical protein
MLISLSCKSLAIETIQVKYLYAGSSFLLKSVHQKDHFCSVAYMKILVCNKQKMLGKMIKIFVSLKH